MSDDRGSLISFSFPLEWIGWGGRLYLRAAVPSLLVLAILHFSIHPFPSLLSVRLSFVCCLFFVFDSLFFLPCLFYLSLLSRAIPLLSTATPAANRNRPTPAVHFYPPTQKTKGCACLPACLYSCRRRRTGGRAGGQSEVDRGWRARWRVGGVGARVLSIYLSVALSVWTADRRSASASASALVFRLR